jgi:hypothetical protein
MGSHYVLLRKADILFTALRYWQFGLRAQPNHTRIALHAAIVKIRLWDKHYGIGV